MNNMPYVILNRVRDKIFDLEYYKTGSTSNIRFKRDNVFIAGGSDSASLFWFRPDYKQSRIELDFSSNPTMIFYPRYSDLNNHGQFSVCLPPIESPAFDPDELVDRIFGIVKLTIKIGIAEDLFNSRQRRESLRFDAKCRLKYHRALKID